MLRKASDHEELTQRIIGCGIRVHEYFGPGLFESVYARCFAIELREAGLQIDSARAVPLVYRGHDLGAISHPISSSKTWSSWRSRPSRPSLAYTTLN